MSWLTLLRRIGGTALFIVGVVALALPIIPGWLLIALSLYLLSIDSPGLERRIAVIRVRHTWLDRCLRPLDRFLGHQPETWDEKAGHEDDRMVS